MTALQAKKMLKKGAISQVYQQKGKFLSLCFYQGNNLHPASTSKWRVYFV